MLSRKKEAKLTKPPNSADSFYIVGVGGSAGALSAFSELLKNIPADSGLAFVIVQHLLPTSKSNLAEILSARTGLSVTEVEHGVSILPNHIYVIPPNKRVIVRGNILELSPRERSGGLNLPINTFFVSLAESKKDNAIGVLLSGTGSDGTLGMRAIRAVGGINFAEDKTAEFSDMPENAVAAGVVDHVASPAMIAKKLLAIAQGDRGKDREKQNLRDGEDHILSDAQEKGLGKILGLLQTSSSVDFTYYKPGTIRRRIARRMLLHDQKDYAEYADFLEKNPAEAEALYQDVLIKVTDFFRDKEVFDLLRSKIFPDIVKRNPPAIRIWIPGCSTGEEVYSFAICIAELLEEHGKNIPVQIFGTDLSEVAISGARRGAYPESITASVPAQLLEKYFTKSGGKYEIKKNIRTLCIFARHNMVTDTPFSRLDMISCRNVLIYLDSFLQKKAFPVFHYALNPDGILLLGTAESASNFQDLFKIVDQQHKIYAKKSTPHQAGLHILIAPHPKMPNPPTPVVSYKQDIEKEADAIVLAKHSPAGLIVNSDLAIVQFRGNVTAYLEPTSGRATLDLIKMANKRLLPKMLEIITEAKKSGKAASGVYGAMKTEIEVVPLGHRVPGERYFLVLFRETDLPEAKATSAAKKKGGAHSPEESLELQKELRSTVEQLQELIEARDASNEELRAAHEEVMSTNEELQSTNEELETTKEELQSANEELMTLNAELQHRNEELERHEKELYRKDEFLSFLGHELRNPLSPIVHSLELAELHGVTDPTLKRLLGVIGRQTEQMSEIIKSLLDAARAIGGKIKLQLEPADFGTVVKNAVEAAAPLIEAGKHDLKVELLDEAIYILLDPQRVEQIIVNLLNNAAKYTPSGGQITLRVTEKDNKIILSVKDSGIGISEEMMPRIFLLFSQANQSLSNFKGGLGVGLMLAKTLAELHGGSLTAASAGPGQGSEFTLRLPINKDTRGVDRVPEIPDLANIKLTKKKVMVVDDNVALADSFSELLRALDQDVTTVYSGASAVEAAKDGDKPDLIFIDIAMPQMSGYELVKILRKEPGFEKTKFIALTGFGDEYSQQSKDVGFDDHRTKPLSAAELVGILSRN